MVEHGLSFSFLPESRSGELAPGGVTAFWKQRLGLYYIFVFRWFMQFCTVVIVVFNAYPCVEGIIHGIIIHDSDHNKATPSLIKCMQLLSTGMYGALVIFSFIQALLHEPRCCLLAGLFLFFSVTPLWVCFNSAVLCVSLVRVASGTTGAWVVTTRSSGYELRPPGARKQQDNLLTASALWVLAVGFAVLGALAGAWVGHMLGRREEDKKMWGWVPFGIGATRTVVVDGRYVAVGAAVGCILGVIALFVIRAVFRVTASCASQPDLCACDGATDEDEETACQHPLLVPSPPQPLPVTGACSSRELST